MEIESAAFHAGTYLKHSDRKPAITSVYVCFDNEPLAITAALVLSHHLRDQATPIVVRASREKGLPSLLRLAGHPSSGSQVQAFPLLDHACRPELVLGAPWQRPIPDSQAGRSRARLRRAEAGP
jgi:hypothetical protein